MYGHPLGHRIARFSAPPVAQRAPVAERPAQSPSDIGALLHGLLRQDAAPRTSRTRGRVAHALALCGRFARELRGGGRGLIARELYVAEANGTSAVTVAQQLIGAARGARNRAGALVAAAKQVRKSPPWAPPRTSSLEREPSPGLQRARALVAMARVGALGPRAAAIVAAHGNG
jgi:hypothetical protein